MVHIPCRKCGNTMDKVDENTIGNIYEGKYRCDECKHTVIHTQEYDDDGCLMRDLFVDEDV